MNFQDALTVSFVAVSGKFIDEYMPGASGDYVKVYLWLLRNAANGKFRLTEAADALMLSEGDVERAVRYWKEKGVITMSEEKEQTAVTDELRDRYRGQDSAKILARLKLDDAFRQLLIIVQTYLSRIIGDSEMQVLAYLYDGLGLPAEVIDYLVAYAVDNGKGNMSYIEAAGKDWAENGVRDEKSAKKYVSSRRTGRMGRASAGEKPKKSPRAVSTERKTDYNKLAMEELAEKLVD